MPETIILLRSPRADEFQNLDSAQNIITISPDFAGLENRKAKLISPAAENHYFDRAFSLIQRFPHRTYGGKKLADHLLHAGHSLYYFTRFILINRLTVALKEYMLLETILGSIPSDHSIRILNISPYTRHFDTERNLHFETRGTVKAGKLNKRAYYLLFIIRALIGLILNSLRKKASHLFLFPQVEPQPLLNRHSLEMEMGNPITDYYLEDLLEQKDAYILDERYPLNEGSYKLNRQNILGRYGRKHLFFEPFLLRSMLALTGSSVLKDVSKRENNLFQTINKEETDPHIRLLNHIHYDLKRLRKLAVIRMKAADLLFKRRKINVLGCIDEYSVKSKAVADAATQKGIKTYAIQHGIIHKNHMGYNYLPQDKPYVLFTDQLFVYGEEIRNMLIAQNHAVTDIIVSGQLRTDIIPTLLEKQQSIAVPGLDDSKPIILYTSQPVFSVGGSEVRDAINRDFFALSREFPNCSFVLKPHPRETDWSYFHELAASVNASDFLITNADLYLLLSKCSMLLTHSSSVGPEAVNFNKPLVVQDYLDIDIVNYIRDGIGIKARNISELRKVIGGILKGEVKYDQAAYDNYRKRFSVSTDGKVSQRILKATDS